jgi:hypothetical protein
MKTLSGLVILLCLAPAALYAQAPNDIARHLKKGVEYSRGKAHNAHRSHDHFLSARQLRPRPSKAGSPGDNSADQLNAKQLQSMKP